MTGPNGSGAAAGISNVVAQTILKVQESSVKQQHAAKDLFITTFMEKLERELAPITASSLAHLTDNIDMLPDGLRQLVEQMTAPTHQTDLVLQGLGLVASILSISKLGGPPIQNSLNTLWSHTPDLPLSPAELAEGVVRGLCDLGYATKEASLSGVNEERQRFLVDLAGNPPGLMDLVAAWRRGTIKEGDLERAILQSRVKPEWMFVYHALRYLPLSPSEAVEAAIQGHLSHDEAQHYADMGGVNAADFDVMYETAGNPPGAQDIGDLLNRGKMTQAEAVQAIRETRYKPKYTDLILSLREQLPPREAVVLMLERAVITLDQGIGKMMQLGYNKENATFLCQEALARKHAPEKDLAKGEITSFYANGIITRTQAVGFLALLGYDGNESGFILDLVDTALERQAKTAAVNKVRSLYVGYRLNATETGADLDKLGIAHNVRDLLVTTWDVERNANAKDLTQAQYTVFYQNQLITKEEYIAGLMQIGYSEVHAKMFQTLHGPVEDTLGVS